MRLWEGCVLYEAESLRKHVVAKGKGTWAQILVSSCGAPALSSPSLSYLTYNLGSAKYTSFVAQIK